MAIEVINPATGKVDKKYELMSQKDIDKILTQMEKVRTDWLKTTFEARSQLMRNAAKILREQQTDYAKVITREMGKPISQAKGEIEKCTWLCEHYADHAEHYLQPELIKTESKKAYRCYQPLGIIYAVMPWNFPFWQVLRFAVPNLMGGNAGVLKHAPNSTGAALAIEKLFEKAGFPKGLFRSLVIDVDLSPYVISHPLVQGVTLTGSERAGTAVASDAAKALKKVVLELGGSDPYLILDDADLDIAAEQCAKSRLSNAGQVCISAKRIIVVEKIREAFLKKLMEQVAKFKCGDPMDENTTMGPMAREDLRKQLDDQVKRSIAAGAKCLQGGKPVSGDGFFYEPTVLANIKKGMSAYDEELFGPVVCIFDAKDEADAIRIANDSAYGLGAAVFTQDLARGEKIAREQLHAGTCNVNMLVGSDPRLPFGGIKRSGYGRELAAEGIHEFMNIKTVSVA